MQIHGLNKTTLLDYPEHVAATVFTGGCNFRCPFCHNKDLVLNPTGQPVLEEEEVLAFFKKRKGIITGVCVTGGEPTLQPDLKEFLGKVKEIGLSVKLDTNGYRPEILMDLVESGLVDYVAMDIKSSKAGYTCATGYAHAAGYEEMVGSRGEACENKENQAIYHQFRIENIEAAVTYLMQNKVPYEFRTTVVSELHSKKEIEEIGKWIEGCRAYYLQAFEENENVIQLGFHSCSKEEMIEFSNILKKYIQNTQIRGLDID